MTYEQYIASGMWQRLREQALRRDGNRCRLCNSPDNLEVHHRYYPPRSGGVTDWRRDKLDALTTLCAEDHKIFTNRSRRERYAKRANWDVTPPPQPRVANGKATPVAFVMPMVVRPVGDRRKRKQ